MDGGTVIVDRDGDAGAGDAAVQTGRWRALPERGDPVVPGLLCGRGWVALMYARGRLDVAQLRAAVDIGRGLEAEGVVSASGLRAIDPAALVVDGGNRTSPPLAPVGGIAYAGEVERVRRWRRDLRADVKRGVLRGRHGSLWRDLLVARVITGAETPAALDRVLGLREGRVRDAVLVLLSAYADTFGLVVRKNSS